MQQQVENLKKYFKYQTYSFRGSTYSVENGVETPVFGQTT